MWKCLIDSLWSMILDIPIDGCCVAMGMFGNMVVTGNMALFETFCFLSNERILLLTSLNCIYLLHVPMFGLCFEFVLDLR